MDFSSEGITYIFLIFPTLIALTVVAQGIHIILRRHPGGGVILGFGLFFLALVAASYFFFIRI